MEGIKQEVRRYKTEGIRNKITGSNAGRNRLIRKQEKMLSQERRKEVKKRRKSKHRQVYVGRRAARKMLKWNADNEKLIVNMTRRIYVNLKPVRVNIFAVEKL
jgi:UDP-glucose 4-epimerase